ncbi:hypothetical protein VTK56DRAFT_5780 [Thermocarpiscus australiensis]
MVVDAEELLIRPFRDVVALGTAALTNVTTHVPRDGANPTDNVDCMSRAAQALVREGERALKKVQSVWSENVDSYGDRFREAMVQQASIENRRLQLEDILWDFDDVIQLDEFDQERYSALQAATKALALDIVETSRRLKLDVSSPPPVPHGGFPPLPPLPSSRPGTRSGPVSRPSSLRSVRTRTLSTSRPVQDDAGFSHHVPPENAQASGELARRPDRDAVPASPSRDIRVGSLYFIDNSANDITASRGLASDVAGTGVTNSARSGSHASHMPYRLFKRDAPRELTPPSSPRTSSMAARFRDLTLDASVRPGQAFDAAPSPSTTTYTRTSILSHTSSRTSSSALLGSLDSLFIPEEPPTSSTSEAAGLASSTVKKGDGMMTAQELLRDESSSISDHRKSNPINPRLADCTIGEDSTYHKLKGLCKGAVRLRTEGHWGNVKISTEYDYGSGGSAVAAGGNMLRASDGIVVPLEYEVVKVVACECGYAHPLDEVDLDKSSKPEAIRVSDCGARYRLRLLYKSHLRKGSSADSHLACPWCVHAGATVREGDATVFRSADDLLRHLARHPQPLPPVEGLSVCYGRHAPESASRQVFDLHLPEPAVPVPMPDSVARLATATAIKDHYRRPGRGKLDKPPKYDGEMLEFMEGARIVGVMFPEKWGGKWCLGRHDGMFGAFPAKAIELRAPQESEIPMGGDSGMSVTTRWKWNPPNVTGVPWLSFGKGEVISNVQCLYADYWCWSGTNSKGKTGVFPQSHIDLQTLRGQDTTASKKPSRGRSLFGYRSSSSAEAKVKGSGKDRNSVVL